MAVYAHAYLVVASNGAAKRDIPGLLLTPRQEGTSVLPCTAIEDAVTLLKAGFSPAEIIFPKAQPESIENLELQF